MSLFDLNDVDPQRELAPSGIYQLKAKVRPGSVVDPLCTAKNMRTRHLELELEVIGGNRGEYNGHRIWEYLTLDVDEKDYSNDIDGPNIKSLSPEQAAKFQTAVSIGRKKLRALVDSAYALHPDDQTDEAKAKRRAVSDDLLTVNGLCFWAQVGTRKRHQRLLR